jgi:hypothetical protein
MFCSYREAGLESGMALTNSLGDQIVDYLGSDSVCVFILGK